MFKLHGVVVLYHPDDTVWLNIQSYVSQVDVLFVVDNSDVKNTPLVSELRQCSNLVYIDNNGNKGIATALNIGAEQAIAAGATWLLTMDQDSVFIGHALAMLVAVVKALTNDHDVGILSPVHGTANVRAAMAESVCPRHDAVQVCDDALKAYAVDSVMTSGNMINLAAYQQVGGFLDKYFIDCVDHEYCLALKRKGYRIMVLPSSVLEHHLGDMTYRQWFGRKVYYTNHSAIRRYYITRNRLDLVRRHGLHSPLFVANEQYKLLGEWLKVLLFEQDKWQKTVFTFKGAFDFVRRRFGKIS